MPDNLYNDERLIDVPKIDSQIENEHRHRYKIAADYVKGKYVLDAACGSGYGTEILAEVAQAVIGIDYSAEVIEYCRSKNEKENATFIQMSVIKLSFPDNYFDVVVSFETLEHLSLHQQPLFMKEVKRVLKQDGLFIVSSPDKVVWEYWANEGPNKFHLGEICRDDFERLLKQFFCQTYICAQDYVAASIVLGEDNVEFSKLIYSQNYDFNTPPLYNIAFCSDVNLPQFLSSIYLQNRMSAYIESKLGFSEMYLYFDQGHGFCEADKIKAPLKFLGGGLFSVTFWLPAEATALRFDPGEKACCIKGIHLSDHSLSINAVNGEFQSDGSFLFLCADPIFLIEGAQSYPKDTEISIELKYSPLEQVILPYIRDLKKQQALLVERNRRLRWKRKEKRKR